VAEQDGARIPGANRTAMDVIDVPDALWTQTLALAAK
jgi:(2R)-3-sulfolactate dehydrogenase (NADP+)